MEKDGKLSLLILRFLRLYYLNFLFFLLYIKLSNSVYVSVC